MHSFHENPQVIFTKSWCLEVLAFRKGSYNGRQGGHKQDFDVHHIVYFNSAGAVMVTTPMVKTMTCKSENERHFNRSDINKRKKWNIQCNLLLKKLEEHQRNQAAVECSDFFDKVLEQIIELGYLVRYTPVELTK